MKPKPVIAVLVALCLAVQFTGCSWVFMKRAPEEYKDRPWIECSDNRAAIADTAIGLTWLAGATVSSIYAVGASTYRDPDEKLDPRGTAVLFTVVFALYAVVHGFSALTGYCWANTCEETKKNHSNWLANWMEPLNTDEKAEAEKMVKEDWILDMRYLKKAACSHWTKCGKWDMKSCLNYYHSVVLSSACIEKQFKARCDDYNNKQAEYYDICWPPCKPGPEKCHYDRRHICDEGHLVVIDCAKWCESQGEDYTGLCIEKPGSKTRCVCW